MKSTIFVADRLICSAKFPGAKLSEILCGFWNYVVEKLHLQTARCDSSNRNVEENNRVAAGKSLFHVETYSYSRKNKAQFFRKKSYFSEKGLIFGPKNQNFPLGWYYLHIFKEKKLGEKIGT